MAFFMRILLRLFFGLVYVDSLLLPLSDISYLVMTLQYVMNTPYSIATSILDWSSLKLNALNNHFTLIQRLRRFNPYLHYQWTPKPT